MGCKQLPLPTTTCTWTSVLVMRASIVSMMAVPWPHDHELSSTA